MQVSGQSVISKKKSQPFHSRKPSKKTKERKRKNKTLSHALHTVLCLCFFFFFFLFNSIRILGEKCPLPHIRDAPAPPYLLPVNDIELALFSDISNITRFKPLPVLAEGLFRCVWFLPVTLHDVGAPDPEFTGLVHTEFGHAVFVDDLEFCIGEQFAD